ncbi:MAG TPA: glycosyltransferase family 2 protein [Bryobacteraceae bacterium]|nr:glycosyltransferase family 2 protein [Bryobacteraceae bacterium]
MTILILVAKGCLLFAIAVLALYGLRHYTLALYRLSIRRPRDMMEITGYFLPRTSVLVPMHNEEKVAADLLQALVEGDYDRDRIEILAIDDRSEDRTGEIISDFAARYPVIKAIHRRDGEGGKAAALELATRQASGEVLLLFDADYFPGRAMVKQLTAPFCDPEVGAVMGRVVPHNSGSTLLAALLGLERAAGYQVGQQARYNLGLTPQFGGTVGGVRASALRAVGGWNTKSLTEDTDLTFRLIAKGWKVAYVNRAECYEEVPEAWEVRKRQIARWATGHTDCLHRLWSSVSGSKFLSRPEKVDALFVLGCYLTAPILVLGWLASLVLFFSPEASAVPPLLLALAFAGYQVFGNQATFFELGAAALLDGDARRVLLIPVNLFNFFASTAAICGALLRYYVGRVWGSRGPRWHKTKRFRENSNGEQFRNGNGSGRGLFSQRPSGAYTYTFSTESEQ